METDAFGKRVRYLRTLAKLTQARMAEQLGITPEHLGNIERGVSAPSFELIYRMANVLNTEPFNLFLFPRDRSEPCRSPVDISWSCFYSGMGNWEYDMLTGSMHWSKSLYRLLGFSPKDVEPSIELMLERVHPNDLERIREKWLQLLAGDNVAPIIFRVRIDKGEYRSVINFGEARKEQNRIVGFNIDITENCMLLDAFRELQDLVEEETAGRTRSLNDMIVLLASAMDTKDSVQAELEDSENLFRSFVENIRDIFHVMEQGRGFTYVSPVCEDILGVTASALVENVENFYTLVHPEDREQIREIHSRRLRGEKADGLFRIIRKDGGVRLLRSRSFILPGSGSDESPKSIGITEDVTDVHHAESARRRAEDLLEKVLAAVGDAVCIVDGERRIVRSNAAMARLYGNADRLIGRTFEEVVTRTAGADGPIPLAESSGELIILQSRNTNEEPRSLEVHEFPNSDGGAQDGAVIVLRDVTDRQWNIHALECACEQKNRLLAYLSHEMRTPLNGIMGLLQLLRMEQGEDGHEYLDAALASGAILTDIVNGVLDLSLLDSGRVSIFQETFDPREVVQSVILQFRHMATMKSLRLDGGCDDTMPSVLVGDKTRIRQILSNLVGNAIKFTDQGAVTVQASLISGNDKAAHVRKASTAEEAHGLLRIAVRDTGEGIPEDKLGCIFDEYTQANDSGKNAQGYGLGLAITKCMLNTMGGDIQVQSEPGQGSAFTCLIPVKPES